MCAKPLPTCSLVAVLCVALTLSGTVATWANEVQLAGMRLGQHALDLIQVYGQPDAVILGSTGPGSVGTGGGGAAAPAGGGAEMGGGAEAGGPPAGGGGGGGLMGMLGGMLGGMMGGGAEGMGAQPMGEGGPGGAAGGVPTASAGGAATRFAGSQDVPTWADPVHIQMTSKEQMWCYRRDDITLGFVLDRDGYIVKIGVAGKSCNWVRTAMNEPLRTIKLGDSFNKVVKRYGYPETITNDGGDGFSRDTTLHYGYANNVTFRLQEMKVVSIRIWEIDIRGAGPQRVPSESLGPTGGISEGPLPPTLSISRGAR